MAYRRRQQQQPPTISASSDEIYGGGNIDDSYASLGLDRTGSNSSSTTTTTTTTTTASATTGGSSLATRAIRASSAARRDSSLSSAYGFNNNTSPSLSASSSSSLYASNSTTSTTSTTSSAPSKDFRAYEYTSMKSMNDSKQGFWSSLARKAKSILEDDEPQQSDSPERSRQEVPNAAKDYQAQYSSHPYHTKVDNPKLQKGLNAISSSLNYIGNAVEEGLTVVENRTADLINGTRKHMRKKPSGATENRASNHSDTRQQTQMQTHGQQQMQSDINLQLKASRDVAMAMAAKAKLLLRELKTVKADLAFAKERCAQLEDENKILRENRGQGSNPEDDDLIRLQLETLLAEKARLAHENSVYARENRFLREVVEYHQLTMQDVVYLDEGTEEVTEVYPIKVVTRSDSSTSLPSPVPAETSFDKSLLTAQSIPPIPVPPPGINPAFTK